MLLLGVVWSCKTETTPTPTPTPTPVTKSTAKAITKFSFAALSPAVDATIDETAKTISATLPAATDLTKLVPTITLSDKATINPASGTAQDFSKEVSYTVTAEDGSTVVYKVNVKKETVASTSSCRLKTIQWTDDEQTRHTYEYDAKKRLAKVTISIYGTTTTVTSIYKYDENDYVTDYSYTSLRYSETRSYSYQNGRRVSEKGTAKSSNSAPSDVLVTYEYDGNGNLTKMNDNGEVYLFSNGKTTNITSPGVTYELNGQGFVKKRTIITDGSYSVYTYNTDGSQTLSERFDKSGKRTSYNVMEYAKDKQLTIDVGINKGVPIIPNQYGNSLYQMKKRVSYFIGADNVELKLSEQFSVYDSKGKLITFTYKDGTGKTVYVATYTYQDCD